MKTKIISILSILIMLLAFTAESIYAWGGASPNPSGGGSNIVVPPPHPPQQPIKKEIERGIKEEAKWDIDEVDEAMGNLDLEGLIVIKFFKSDGTPISEFPYIKGLVSSAKIKYGSSEGYICEFDSVSNAENGSKIILEANERGDPYTRSWRKDNIIIVLGKNFPEEKANAIFDALKKMGAAR